MVTEEQETPIQSAVIGLGQVGSRFDEDPGRTAVWSHAGAYLALPQLFRMTAAADVSKENAKALKARCTSVPVYPSVDELLKAHRPHFASICTPAETHADILFALLASPDIRLIWCEKPLSLSLDGASRMVEACRQRGVSLMVSFNRRVMPLWQRAAALIEAGAIGTTRSIRIAMPNRLFSIGSHAADLALFLGGAIEDVTSMRLPALDEGGEPAVSALLRYKSGAGGVIQITGMKAQLIVEAEAVGDSGRLLVREDRSTVVLERFMTSSRFAGYQELADATVETVKTEADFSPFVAMARNAVDHLRRGVPLVCDGSHALAVQQLIARMHPATSSAES
jgi:predicted dehydrogenase